MKYALVLAGTALALGYALPAHAVVLEQKWQAGQNLGYDLTIDGALNVQASPDAPVIFAGLPLEIDLKGDGKAQLQTISVDGNGVGTVAFKLPQAQFQFQTFGQEGKWALRDGASHLLLNGKPLDIGKGLDLTALSNPTTAVKIGKDGRVRGIEPLTSAPAVLAPDNTDAAPIDPAKAIDRTALMTALVLQSLPSVWPGRDVQPGETWQVKLDVPPALLPGSATAGATPKSLGTFDMTLKGEEQVGAKKLWRVGVVGSIQADASLLNRTGGTAPKAPAAPRAGARPAAGLVGGMFQLDSALQRVQGDVWLDAEAGQISKAELALNSQASGRTLKRGGGMSTPSSADFTGTLQLQLKPNA